jgi:hypothetical protein
VAASLRAAGKWVTFGLTQSLAESREPWRVVHPLLQAAAQKCHVSLPLATQWPGNQDRARKCKPMCAQR